MVDEEMREARGIAIDVPEMFTNLVSLAGGLISQTTGIDEGAAPHSKPMPGLETKRTRPFRGRQYSPDRRRRVIRALTGANQGLRLVELIRATEIPKNSLKDLIDCLVSQNQVCKVWKGQYWVFTLAPDADPEQIARELKELDPGNLVADFNRWREESSERLLPRKLAERLLARLNSESIESLASRLYVHRKALSRLISESIKAGVPDTGDADPYLPWPLSVDAPRPVDLETLWIELSQWRATRKTTNERLPSHIGGMLAKAMRTYRKSLLAKVLGVGFSTLEKVQREAGKEVPAEPSNPSPKQLVTLALPAEMVPEVLENIRRRYGTDGSPYFFSPTHADTPLSGVKSNVSPV